MVLTGFLDFIARCAMSRIDLCHPSRPDCFGAFFVTFDVASLRFQVYIVRHTRRACPGRVDGPQRCGASGKSVAVMTRRFFGQQGAIVSGGGHAVPCCEVCLCDALSQGLAWSEKRPSRRYLSRTEERVGLM